MHSFFSSLPLTSLIVIYSSVSAFIHLLSIDSSCILSVPGSEADSSLGQYLGLTLVGWTRYMLR